MQALSIFGLAFFGQAILGVSDSPWFPFQHFARGGKKPKIIRFFTVACRPASTPVIPSLILIAQCAHSKRIPHVLSNDCKCSLLVAHNSSSSQRSSSSVYILSSRPPHVRCDDARSLARVRVWSLASSGLKIGSKRNLLRHTFTFGPFSAVSTPIFAITCYFFSIFRDLQDVHSFASFFEQILMISRNSRTFVTSCNF